MNENNVVKALRVCTSERTISKCSKICPYHNVQDCRTKLMIDAADAIEELSRAQERWITQERNILLKSNKAITAERDAAMKRLCEWCGVGCSMENRRAELCEIAAVGLEFLKDDFTSTDCDWELAEEGE